MEHGTDFESIAWFVGWLVAVGVLFAVGLALPLQTRLTRRVAGLYGWGVVLCGVVVAVLASIGLLLHDTHFDLTREKVFTPAREAMLVVDGLQRPVKLTYFYRAQDANGRRMRDIVTVMARRNPLLDARAVDPDKEPSLTETAGVKIYNAAVIEAEGRRVMVNTVDESELAIGIQRVLRERVIMICFLEGHGELPMENFEFHTHMEGIADHSHGDASSKVVEMRGHGVGRLRRALEAQGYDTRKIVLATAPAVPKDCAAVIDASPRNTFLPAESDALAAYLAQGGSLLAAIDLGFAPEPRQAALFASLGVRLPQLVVVDPLSHYSTDPEMVAVMGYDPHPITKPLSMTFYPGVRPLDLVVPSPPGLTVTPILLSTRDSYTRSVTPIETRLVAPAVPASAGPPTPQPHVLGVAVEGRMSGAAPATEPMRAVIIGDGDVLSNSFLPYMSNADLALSAVRWLVREEKSTAVASRIPVPPLVLLTPLQMRVIFVVVELLLPLAVIGVGVVIWWRRR
ncbi:MAG: Gldg family protein [Burkholderiales bacterium]|nr:Gldg family protein [Burkholderiales bacterium]